jgi:uncharacterized protein YggE
MEAQSVREVIDATHKVRYFAAAALCALTVYLIFASLGELKSYRYIGSGVTPTNTISISGEGTVFAVPDTATFSVSVIERGKDVATAQKAATDKGNKIIAYLKGEGIKDEDIQTTDYSVNPQYDYSSTACGGGYCPPSNPKLVGFEVSQTLSVKVRDTDKAGAVLSGVGSLGASSVSGLSFTVADENMINDQAREKAIRDAKQKAETLAKSLGVEIVRIVGYSEGGSYPYYAKAEMQSSLGRGAAFDGAAPAPDLPVGQNKIISSVTVVYEIR